MDLSINETEGNFAQYLEENIPDDAMCVSAKINLEELPDNIEQYKSEKYNDLKKFIIDKFEKVYALSSGIHEHGEKNIPHIHHHFIIPKNEHSNRTKQKQDWLKKNPSRNLDGITFKFQKLETDKPKFQFLTYPLKERKMMNTIYYKIDDEYMSKGMILFLQETGATIYESAKALYLRQEKSEERKQNAYLELVSLLKEAKFPNFRELCLYLDKEYVAKLDIENIPNTKNYKENVRRIALHMGLLTTYDL